MMQASEIGAPDARLPQSQPDFQLNVLLVSSIRQFISPNEVVHPS
jgi:hypothetical protein